MESPTPLSGSPAQPHLVIEADKVEQQYWLDLWRFRELFYFLAWRDVLVRYKQTAVGLAWAVLRPLATMLIFTLIFGKVAKLPVPEGVPYALLVFAGMLPWQFFATAMSDASGSLIGNSGLISKVYFPRLIVPASAVITAMVDFLITLAIMGLLMVWYRFFPDWRILLLPLFTAVAFAAAFGAGLWLCALNVKYRDVRYVIPFLVQFGLYVSPVGFDSSVVSGPWHALFVLNPMVAVIDGFRWALLGGQVPLAWPALLSSVCVTGLLCLSGVWFFRRSERNFADNL